MKWVSVLVRKPNQSGWYHLRGDGGIGGYEWFSVEDGFFVIDSMPTNKLGESELYWLDQSKLEFETLEKK